MAALSEFAARGFDQASTNAMVRSLGIAKGSLFKYFSTKEDLFREVFTFASRMVGEHVGTRFESLPRPVVARIVALAKIELELYREMPTVYSFFRRVVRERPNVAEALLSENRTSSRSMFAGSMEVAEFPPHVSADDRASLMQILIWVLEGLGKEWFEGPEESLHRKDGTWDDEQAHQYIRELRRYATLVVGG
jgi:AcrR family transcriptional regulator